jgi:hypothetical protein
MEAGQMPSSIGTPLLTMFSEGQKSINPLLNRPQQITGGGGESGGPWINTEDGGAHLKIAAATAAAILCDKAVNFAKVAKVATTRLTLSNMQVSRGGCFDYHFFGRCASHNCSYKHAGRVNESKIDAVIQKMEPALKQFVTANS